MSAWTEAEKHPIEPEPGEAVSLHDLGWVYPADTPIAGTGRVRPSPSAPTSNQVRNRRRE